jgi:23S rRNA (adenine2503-C2)-methyltransferase
MERVFIKDFSLPELEDWVESIGERRFRARQLFKHLYARKIRSWEECTDLSKSFRTQLEFGTRLHSLELLDRRTAGDGTEKFLFELHDGEKIESVLIPDPPRYTLCVSSQAGCALGCRFCYTGSLGLRRNLATGEIVDQVLRVHHEWSNADRHISNIVFMGMGEPLANYDPVLRSLRIMLDPAGLGFSNRRVTLSTVGLVPQLRQLGGDSPVSLAVSLHAPRDDLRTELVPVNRKYPLDELMAACSEYPIPTRKRITFEYVLLDRVNDGLREARELVELLRGVKAKVNLIPFNPHPGAPYRAPKRERVLGFQQVLLDAHLTAPIRESRGSDILAACGQLAARHREQPGA